MMKIVCLSQKLLTEPTGDERTHVARRAIAVNFSIATGYLHSLEDQTRRLLAGKYVCQLRIDCLVLCQLVEVEDWRGQYLVDTRQEVSGNVLLALDVADVGRKLSYKIQLSRSSRGCFVRVLLQGVDQRLVIG